MLNKKILILLAIVFITGWLCNIAYSQLLVQMSTGVSATVEGTQSRNNFLANFFEESRERQSPYDRVKEEDISVYPDKIVINLKDAQWATFTDTNSMDPVIDIGTNAIEIVPQSESEIHVGDIISYRSDYADGNIIHRVVDIDEDGEGWYCTARGDNNDFDDPGKIRFDQIDRVPVALIY
jgi:hypothetical protein